MANILMDMVDKVKGFLNIGFVDLKLELPKEVSRKDKDITGKLIVTAKKDISVKEVSFEFQETWQKGESGSSDYQIKNFVLGEKKMDSKFDLKTGETKEISVVLPFKLEENLNDKLKKEGGVMGALGSLGSMMSKESSTFWFTAFVSIEGARLSATKAEKIKMVA